MHGVYIARGSTVTLPNTRNTELQEWLQYTQTLAGPGLPIVMRRDISTGYTLHYARLHSPESISMCCRFHVWRSGERVACWVVALRIRQGHNVPPYQHAGSVLKKDMPVSQYITDPPRGYLYVGDQRPVFPAPL